MILCAPSRPALRRLAALFASLTMFLCLFLFPSPVRSATTLPAGWLEPEKIGPAGWADLAVDSLGRPQVVRLVPGPGLNPTYDLVYSYKDASGWHDETIRQRSSDHEPVFLQLALDPGDRPHVCYYERVNRDLVYARRDASGWSFETVDWYGDVGAFASLVVDAQGKPHISYYDASHGNLKYASRVGPSNWLIEVADSSASDTGQYSSLALDAGGNPHISYFSDYLGDGTIGHLKYTHRDSAGWHWETVDFGGATGLVGKYTSLALGPDGQPRIAYTDYAASRKSPVDQHLIFGQQPQKYAYKDGAGWHLETVDLGDQTNVYGDPLGEFQSVGLAVDASGVSHLGYVDMTLFGGVKYATRGPGGWQKITVASKYLSGYSAMVLDSTGAPHFAYMAWDQDDICLFYLAKPTILPTPPAPTDLSAAVAPGPVVNLAWQDRSSNETGFEIQRRRGADPFETLAILGPNVTSFADQAVGAGPYTYRIRSFAKVLAFTRYSGFSPEASATVVIALVPAPPTDLLAKVLSSTQIALSWNDASGNEGGFKVERSTGGGPWAVVGTVGAGVTSFTDSGLTPGTHNYRVRAYLSFGGMTHYSAYSNEAAVTLTVSLAPPPPSDLTAVVISGTKVKVLWQDNAEGETGFKLERQVGGGAWTQLATVGANVTSYTDDGLTTGTIYAYRLRAYDTVLAMVFYSGYSNVASATPRLMLGPAPPTELTARAGNLSVELAWVDNATTEAGFKIEASSGGGAWSEIATVTAGTTTYTHTGLAPGVAQRYRVRAYGGGLLGATLYSAYSNEATATPILLLTLAPAAPSGLTAQAAGPAGITLGWTDNAGNEAGVEVERRAPGGAFERVAVLGADETAWTDGGLSPTTAYTYRVRSYRIMLGSTYRSAYSNEAAATTGQLPAPPAPAGLQALSSAPGEIRLTWLDSSADETGFELERCQEAGAYAVIAHLPAGGYTYTDAGLGAGVTYGYRVRAYRSEGTTTYYSAYSNEVRTAVPIPPPPAAPSGLTAAQASETAVTLVWQDNSSNETGFGIERKDAGGEFGLVGTVGMGQTSFRDERVSPGTGYAYRVRAFSAWGYSAYSAEVSAATPGMTPATPPAVPPSPGQEPAKPAAPTVVRLVIDQLTYFVNDEPRQLDAAPVVIQGRTMLPARAVIEALGGRITWDGTEQKVTAILGANTVEVWIGKSTGLVNGEPHPIDPSNPAVVPCTLPPGRTFLPLRFVAENLACLVEWNNDLQQATVTYPRPQQP